MATAAQVNDACEEIAHGLASFLADGDRVTDLQCCLQKLAQLRDEYRREPSAFTPHMDRIKDLSRQVRDALARSRQTLTARYLEAAQAVSAWQAARDACREALLELVGQEETCRLDSPAGWIEVKRSRAVSLPKPGTPERQELAALITQAELWPEVACPVAARLLKAVDSGRFSPQHAGQIARLCPAQTVIRFAVHPNK